MAAPQAISLDKVNAVKALIHRDLVDNMVGLTSDELTKLGIVIITGIENIDTKFVYTGNNAIARAYKAGKNVRAKLGEAVQRDLKVENVITAVPDNIQNYRTKEPISMLGVSSDGLSDRLIELQLRKTTETFGHQVIAGAFHAERNTATNDPMNMYDGFLKKLAQDITDGYVAAAKGNLVTLAPVAYVDPTAPTDAEAIKAYDRFIAFTKKMNSNLKKDCYVITSLNEEAAIIRGYSLKFANAQTQIINAPTFLSHEAKTVKLVGSDLVGTGSKLMAYKPGNLEMGYDLTRDVDPSGAYLLVSQSPDDPLNELMINMQVACGTRILDFNKEAFCTTADAWTAESLVDGVYEYEEREEFTTDELAAIRELLATQG